MEILVSFIAGALFGAAVLAVNVVSSRPKNLGTLSVGYSDKDEQPYLFLRLKDSVESVCMSDKVIFDVVIVSPTRK